MSTKDNVMIALVTEAYANLHNHKKSDVERFNNYTYKDIVTALKVATTLFLLDECDGSPVEVERRHKGNTSNSANMRRIAESWGIEGLFKEEFANVNKQANLKGKDESKVKSKPKAKKKDDVLPDVKALDKAMKETNIKITGDSDFKPKLKVPEFKDQANLPMDIPDKKQPLKVYPHAPERYKKFLHRSIM